MVCFWGTINGFSAHADQAELIAWHTQAGKPERTFLVHGEEDVMQKLAGQLGTGEVLMPRLHEGFEL